MAAGRALGVLRSDRRRGAETFGVDLATDLAARGLDAPVVALASACEPNAQPVDALGPSPLAPATLRALRRRAAGSDRGDGCAMVIAHGSKTLPACALALAGTGVPFVYRSIGDPRAWSAAGWRRRRTSLLLRRPALVTALWPGAADTLASQHGVPRARLRIAPNGVPAARCPVPGEAERAAARARFGLPEDAAVAGYAGSLTPEKQVGAAIAAVGRVPGAWLLLAGDGPERAALEAQAATDAPGRVVFAGVTSGAGPVLAASDAVVLPSRTEGMPGVLIEAGLSGRPAVATDVGGVGEIVAHDETGVLVRSGDVAALATGLGRVLGGEGPALGGAARRRCLDRFEMDVVGALWAGLVAEVVAGAFTIRDH
jgi:glycosyltransferase involved in cell wall biosynthesis